MMHLMEAEWLLINHALERPELITSLMPLENEQEIDALCEDIRESCQFNHRNPLEWKILDAAINNSEIHTELPHMDIPYGIALDMVDAAFSLQDRFAARFPVPPNKWLELVGKEVIDGGIKRH